MELFSAQADVVLDSEFEPFLRPSQRVACSVDSACVLLASDISAQAADAAGGGEQCVRIYPRQCGL